MKPILEIPDSLTVLLWSLVFLTLNIIWTTARVLRWPMADILFMLIWLVVVLLAYLFYVRLPEKYYYPVRDLNTISKTRTVAIISWIVISSIIFSCSEMAFDVRDPKLSFLLEEILLDISIWAMFAGVYLIVIWNKVTRY